MRIRSEQFDTLQARTEEAFVLRLADYLLQRHPQTIVRITSGACAVADLPPDTLRRLVAGGIERGRALGLSWESSLTAYVVLQFVVAPGFDQVPAIHTVLSNPEVEPDERIDELWDRTAEEDWEEARRSYNPHAWNFR